MNDIEIVTLNNGAKEAKSLVNIAMFSLGILMEKQPIAFYELVMKCRDDKHEFFWNTSKVLKDLQLVENDGGIHDSLRNIVLSAIKGDWMDLTLMTPIQKAAGEIKDVLEATPPK